MAKSMNTREQGSLVLQLSQTLVGMPAFPIEVLGFEGAQGASL